MLKDELHSLVTTLLNYTDWQEGATAGQRLFDCLAEALDFDVQQREVIPTAHKGALSAYDSAFCIAYPVRNQAILRAEIKAIRSLTRPKVLYVGPGSFAPFFIFPLLLGSEAHFTLLEVNASALATAKDLISRLGFEDFLQDAVCADEITWIVDQPYDIVLCETTDVGLQEEDTLPIYRNLKQQLPKAVYILKDVVILAGSKTRGEIQVFDRLSAAISRGYIRHDFPYPKAEKVF